MLVCVYDNNNIVTQQKQQLSNIVLDSVLRPSGKGEETKEKAGLCVFGRGISNPIENKKNDFLLRSTRASIISAVCFVPCV